MRRWQRCKKKKNPNICRVCTGDRWIKPLKIIWAFCTENTHGAAVGFKILREEVKRGQLRLQQALGEHSRLLRG